MHKFSFYVRIFNFIFIEEVEETNSLCMWTYTKRPFGYMAFRWTWTLIYTVVAMKWINNESKTRIIKRKHWILLQCYMLCCAKKYRSFYLALSISLCTTINYICFSFWIILTLVFVVSFSIPTIQYRSKHKNCQQFGKKIRNCSCCNNTK